MLFDENVDEALALSLITPLVLCLAWYSIFIISLKMIQLAILERFHIVLVNHVLHVLEITQTKLLVLDYL